MVSLCNFKGAGCGSGFSEAKLVELFLRIETVVPIISNDWEQVSSLLSENFSGRTSDAIRRKFNDLVRAKPSTGMIAHG